MPNPIILEKKIRKRGWKLCWAGWGLFAASLAMPAYYVMGWGSGWACAMTVNSMAWGLMSGQSGGMGLGWDIYYAGFALMNLVLACSPLFMLMFRRDLRKMRKAGLLLGFATLYTASYWALGACLGGLSAIGDLHIGFYAWVTSFALVSSGALHLALRRPNVNVNLRPTSLTRTKEELEANRELENFLRGSEVQPAKEQSVSNKQPEKTGQEDRPIEIPAFVSTSNLVSNFA